MIQLCRVHSAISFCLVIVAVSSLKVKQEPVVTQPAVAERQDAVEVTSLSPEKWGSKAATGHVEQATTVKEGIDSMQGPPLPNNYLALSANAHTSGSNTMLLTTVVLWVVVAIVFISYLNGSSEEDPSKEPFKAPARSPARSPFTRSPARSPRISKSDAPVESMQPYNSPVNPMNGVNSQVTEESNQEALTLCLRCEIFSAAEYANNRISQEHIDECLWIAKTMLQQMPLDEWVAMSENDKQTFEDSVDALLQATPLPPTFGTPDVCIPLSKGSLRKGSSVPSSSASIGSQISFSMAPETDKKEDSPELSHIQNIQVTAAAAAASSDPSPFDTRPIPDKSPTPCMNCGDQADAVSSPASTSADLDEGVFSSVFGSTTTSPQMSQRSSPPELGKVPASGYTVPSSAYSSVPNSPYVASPFEKSVITRLSPRQAMVPPPIAEQEPDRGRLHRYDTPQGLLMCGSSSGSQIPLLSETPDLTNQQRVPGRVRPPSQFSPRS